MPRFGRVVTAMVTPFTAEGALDVERSAALARWLVEQGNDALVVAGTTGESAVLTDEERITLVRTVAEAVDVPVIAGATTNDTAHSVAMTVACAEVGADAILAVTPYYNKPPASGLEAHFRAVAEASDLPVMLYDVPGRTGRRIDADSVVRLAEEVPTIVALKDAAGDPLGTSRLIDRLPDGFEVYSGDEGLSLAFAAYGAVGVVGVASHWSAPVQVEMFSAFVAGDVDRARRCNARLLPSYAFMNTEARVFSQSVKVMLAELGLPVGECRLPLGPAPEGSSEAARAVARDLGLLG